MRGLRRCLAATILACGLGTPGQLLAATPTPLPAGGFTPIVSVDFSLGDPHTWFEGSYPSSAMQVSHGRLVISVVDGYTQFDLPKTGGRLADGQVDALVRPMGNGRAGVMARWNGGMVGHWALYAFWITRHGSAGLSRWRDGQVTDLFIRRGLALKPGRDSLLVLRVRGGRLSASLNGSLVGTAAESQPLAAGYWGLYVSSVTGNGPTEGWFPRVLIAG